MRDYKAIRTELGWIISRKKEMGRLMMLQYLNGYGLWTPNKSSARVFYKQSDAEGAITVFRMKDKKQEE